MSQTNITAAQARDLKPVTQQAPMNAIMINCSAMLGYNNLNFPDKISKEDIKVLEGWGYTVRPQDTFTIIFW